MEINQVDREGNYLKCNNITQKLHLAKHTKYLVLSVFKKKQQQLSMQV